MENQRIQGIVLGNIDYKETSKIVYLYTSYGRISVKSLGAKSKKSKTTSFTQTLNKVSCIVSNSAFPTLIDYTVIDTYNEIKNDIRTFLFIDYILEIVAKLPNDINHKRVYEFLLRILDHARNNIDPFLLTIIFQIKILGLFGVKPILDSCVTCGDKNITGFSVLQGGSICSKCLKNNDYDINVYKMWNTIYYFNDSTNDFSIFSEYNLNLIFDTINQYYSIHVPITIKGLKSLIIKLELFLVLFLI